MNLMLIGEGGSGKDQVASMLSYHRIALADPIRTIVDTLHSKGVSAAEKLVFSMVDGNTPDDLREVLRFYSQIPRTTKNKQALQGIGTYLKDFQEDVWIKQGQAKMVKGSNVITDIRRLSEFNHFKSLGFRSIYVESSEELRIARLKDRDGDYSPSSALHKAEQEITGLKGLCDSTIENNGTLEELKVAVDGAVAWLQFDISN